MTATAPPRRLLRPLVARLTAALPDADLLSRYAADRDDAAFAELVRRHGPTVLGVCRRLTRHPDDADDAFQATFLVLARKADSITATSLGGWLRGVATRAARTAARTARRRRVVTVDQLPDVPATATHPDADTVFAVRLAVGELPAATRAAVELCELGGHTRADAARRLGIPEGTLSSRLAAGRKALAARLGPPAVVPPALLAATASLASDVPSPAVNALAEATMRTTTRLWLLPLLAATAAVGLAAGNGPKADPPPAPAPVAAVGVAPDPNSRLIVESYEHILYLAPDGREVARAQMFHHGERCEVMGNPRPDGAVPVRYRGGLRMLSPVGLARPAERVPAVPHEYIAFWLADGRTGVRGTTDHSVSDLKPLVCEHALVDSVSGEVRPLAIPPYRAATGVAPGGAGFVTIRQRVTVSRAKGLGLAYDLCVPAADGTETVTPIELGREVRSPDGRREAVVRGRWNDPYGRHGYQLVIRTPATNAEAVVLDAPAGPPYRTAFSTLEQPIWSPDGRWLAVVRADHEDLNIGGEQRLVVLAADGSARRTLLVSPAHTPTVQRVLGWQ